MIQIATFLVPQQQDQANEFLRTHKPEGPINFNKDTVVIFYDTGEVSPHHEIAELQELLKSNANARFQQELGLHVMSTQLADLKEERSKLKTSQNKGRVEEIDSLISQITNGISQSNQALSLQDIKADFVKDRIKLLQRTIS